MRLFRQDRPGRWEVAVAAVAKALEGLVRGATEGQQETGDDRIAAIWQQAIGLKGRCAGGKGWSNG